MPTDQSTTESGWNYWTPRVLVNRYGCTGFERRGVCRHWLMVQKLIEIKRRERTRFMTTGEFDAELEGASAVLEEWDKHERHIGQILIAAGAGDLWPTIYAAWKSDQEMDEPEPGEWAQFSDGERAFGRADQVLPGSQPGLVVNQRSASADPRGTTEA